MMGTPVWYLPWALRCLSQQGYRYAFPASPDARGDPVGSATLGTRWVRRPVGATGLIDGCHVALGPGRNGYNFSREGPSTPSGGHPSTRFRQSYCLLGQMGVPKAVAIRAEKAVRWSEMIGSST
ncbi:hypothetical protein TIFTF001_035672 [Ficus carica]|uniref:Uncharacterized protein n=1 Tax=Ficus carica TaxID=3494 RepID=A0AA88E2R5_FICCA|nr:hypothetical protein TIFTF001_035672 [Ficus carica]